MSAHDAAGFGSPSAQRDGLPGGHGEVDRSGPIFIVGSMRSGSTLFRLILDSHPHIAISEETGFMGALAATKAIPNWKHGREWFGRLGWSETELDDRLREFYSGMFTRYAASQGKQRWGDKTPLHSRHIPEMARIFPNAVFVGITRHPGAVVSSLRRSFHYGVADAASYWETTNADVVRCGADLGDDRFALLRYEDLVGTPEPVLRELMSWLGEPWSDDLLRHHDVQLAKGAPRLVDGHTNSREPIRGDRAERWARALTATELETVRGTTGPLAEFFGYDPSEPRQAPLVDENTATGYRHLLTGDVLAKRQRDHGDLDLSRRLEPLVVPEMGTEELVKRLRQAEFSLARIRSRPSVRLADSVRRAQRRVSLDALLRRFRPARFRRG